MRIYDPNARFDASYVVDPATGCWNWTRVAPVLRGGGRYGFMPLNGKLVKATRFAYRRFVGPLPDDLTIDHLCKNTLCVNPAHLEAVTMRENILRSNSPSAICARRTHCKHGHELTPDNIIRYRGAGRKNERVCRECNKRKCNARTPEQRARDNARKRKKWHPRPPSSR
jgi:hypothetical protein